MAGPGANRFYSSTAVQTSLAAGISAANTTMQVNSTTGFPASTPYLLSIDQNTVGAETVLVTSVASTTLTITRGYDGTPAASHNNGAAVVHVMSAIDLREPQNHLGANDAVHGLSVNSLVVGTTDTQTLTNKTLTAPTVNSGTINTPTVVSSGGTLTLPAGPDTLVGRATTDTLTNKTLTSPVETNPSVTGGAAITATNTTTVPLTINGVASQTADLLDVKLTAGGTVVWTTNSSGNSGPGNGKQLDLTGASTSNPILGSAATTYTPTWASSANPQPAIGNGTLSGRYIRLGRFVWGYINVVWGSTTTAGTGNWTFSVPFAANTTSTDIISGSGFLLPNDGRVYGCLADVITGSQAVSFLTSDASLVGKWGVLNATSYTFANTNTMFFSFMYEAAVS